MSQALASARKRRAPPNPNPVQALPNTSTANNSQSGLTLPQVISLIDRRLINLETFVNKQQSENEKNVSNDNKPDPVLISSAPVVDHTEDIVKLNENVHELANEFNARYDILANEILDIKNLLLKLQSFTMEVNKSLMDERIRILSDIREETDENSNKQNESMLFSLEDTSLGQNDTESLDNTPFAVSSDSTQSTTTFTPLYNSPELQMNM